MDPKKMKQKSQRYFESTEGTSKLKKLGKQKNFKKGRKKFPPNKKKIHHHFIDTKGSFTKGENTSAKRFKKKVLGISVLDEQERELANDLFGDTADMPPENTNSSLWGPEMEVQKALKEKDSREELTYAVDVLPSEPHLEEDKEEMGEDGEEEYEMENMDGKGNRMSKDPYAVLSKDEDTSMKPAWIDEDDESITLKDVVGTMSKFRGKRGIREESNENYTEVLRDKFVQVIGGTPEWADLEAKPKVDSSDDDSEDLIRHTGDYLSRQTARLPKTVLEFKKLRNLNESSRAEGAIIKASEFSPHFPVALVAGSSGNLGCTTLFQVDGKFNHKIQSIRFPHFPIKTAHFLQDGRRFVIGSKFHGHFFVYDMEVGKQTRISWNKSSDRMGMPYSEVSPDGRFIAFKGKAGQIHLYDARALSHVETLQMPCDAEALAFNQDGSRMYCHGDSGEVFVWDMNTRDCIHKFIDDGCISGTSIAVSPSSQYIACGSSSGIVNIYELNEASVSLTPKPIKVLDKLVTPISCVSFNASSEILAMASDHTDEALKLVHFPSMTIFTNFPGVNSSLQRIQTVDFSPRSGYFTAANNAGTSFLYRLKHFTSY